MIALRRSARFSFGVVLLVLFRAGGVAQGGRIATIAGRDWVLPVGLAENIPLGALYGVSVDSVGNIIATDSGNQVVVKITTTGTLTVVAGYGPSGFTGDGGLATNATLSGPGSVVTDGLSNIYFVDGNSRVRKVSSSGVITTVAGNGSLGFSGDGGPAAKAALRFPQAVAVDASGNLYISDQGNHRVRKVDATGTIFTVAGSGVQGFSGDGGPATAADLHPAGIAVDADGNLYIADRSGCRVRRVNSIGAISSIAGNGSPNVSGDGGLALRAGMCPGDVAVDRLGNVYIVDSPRIRKISPNGIITTVAGNELGGFSGDGGPATSASMSPWSIAVDSNGNLYIADGFNRRIRRVSATGTITTIAGNGDFRFGGDGGPATSAFLHSPGGVVVDAAGNLYISDFNNHRIRRMDTRGIITTAAGTGLQRFDGDGIPATGASLQNPQGLALDAAGNLYIADTNNNRVRKIDLAGTISTVAGNGAQGVLGDGGPATIAAVALPGAVALDSAGNLYIAETLRNRIRKVNLGGTITTVAGDGRAGFSGDGGPATSASLNLPSGVVVDRAGAIYIADTFNNRVRKVTSAGVITTAAGTGSPGSTGDGGPAVNASLFPTSVSLDATGNLYITDGDRVRMLSPGGTISAAAGTGTSGFSGDGGPALGANLGAPKAVAVTAEGLYIADYASNRVRKVSSPSLAPNRLVNAASFAVGSVAPGSLASLFVSLDAPVAGAIDLPLPTLLNGAQVSLNSIAVPLVYVSSTQINLQVPWELRDQTTASLAMTFNGLVSKVVTVGLAAANPGIFTLDSSGAGAGAVFHANGQLVSAESPALPGEVISIYCTGVGSVTNQPASGAVAPSNPLSQTVIAPTVTIGGAESVVRFAGLAPGFVGLYQLNVEVPNGAPTGRSMPVVVTSGGTPSNAVTMAIQAQP